MDDKKTCMACSCPCDAHKEHNHGTDGAKEKPKACDKCGDTSGTCTCGK